MGAGRAEAAPTLSAARPRNEGVSQLLHQEARVIIAGAYDLPSGPLIRRNGNSKHRIYTTNCAPRKRKSAEGFPPAPSR